MKEKKLRLRLLLLSGFGLIGLHAQEAIPTSGGNASGSGGSVSYTVGQLVYTTYTGTNGTVANGVQQPFEIFIITGLEEAKNISLKYSVYPNPSIDYLILKVDGDINANYNAALYDINGKLLETIKVEGSVTNIGMANLLPTMYFLKVTQGGKEIKTFKIIKK